MPLNLQCHPSPVRAPRSFVEDESREDPECTVKQAELPSTSASASQPWLNVMGSRYLLDWMAELRISLAFTTYQTGKLFFVGRKPDQAISVFERMAGGTGVATAAV